MKRDSKGFTLVELLAAIVILGILIGVSVPIIVSLLDTSRNKMYINDAKKLVTRAEYKLKSSSSAIEKPDEGDCILISMVYLDSSEFDNPPNEGEYEKESSYVVVKNNGGKLEYSVSIVEKVKRGGYKGVELVKYSTLNERNAESHVVNFKETDLVTVEAGVDKGYINRKLGTGYISSDNSITAIYNYPDLDDSSSNNDSVGIPKITLASLVSTSNSGYNSLDVTLQLKAEDRDTPRNQLQVYFAVDSGYESATTPISYGSDDTFSYDINLANYGKHYDGSNVKIYVIVKDGDGNATKKTMTYKIHKNVAPEIDDTAAITKRNEDSTNMTIGLINLPVSDDIDDNSSLFVCFRESLTDEEFNSCDNYQKYSSKFSSENTMEYQFCNGTCQRDGSKHYLTIFVKDSLGGITKKKFDYTFSTNTQPEIRSLQIKSKVEEFTTTGSKTVVVRVTAVDDVDENDRLKVKVSDGSNSAVYNYTSQPIYYTINSLYDGSTKNVTVSVIDSENQSTSRTEAYTLYKNKAPEIKSFDVSSSATVCTNQALCPPENGGHKIVNVLLSAQDDIDYENLLVCLSLDENSCSNYTSYTNYDNKTAKYEIQSDYDGSTKTIYAFVKDSYGVITKSSVSYKLYKNQAPVIEHLALFSKSDGKPAADNLNAILRINAYDDFDDASKLKIQIIEDGNVKVNNAPLSNYLGHDNDYKLSGTYDGRTRNVEIKVIDLNGLATSRTLNYDVYDNEAPVIEMFNVFNKDAPCRDDLYCPLEEVGNYKAYYKVDISDDIDDDESIQVCLSETNSCTNYSPLSNYANIKEVEVVEEDDEGNEVTRIEQVKEYEIGYTFNVSSKPYDGSVKHLYLFVKDSVGEVTVHDSTYTLYKNKAPSILVEPELVSNADEDELNIFDVTFSVAAEDDIDETFKIKYCYRKENSDNTETVTCTGDYNYQESRVLKKNLFGIDPPNGETYYIYAVLTDSYGAKTTTNEIEYKVFTDKTPSIFYSNIISGKRIYKNSAGNVDSSLDGISDPSSYNPYTRLKIRFSVDDLYDTYTVCVSNNNSTCTNYQATSYIGNNCSSASCDNIRRDYDIDYDMPGFLVPEEHPPINLYLFAKDSYGKVSNASELYSGYYTACLETDKESAVYEYEFNATQTQHDLNHNQPISIDRCAGQCYNYNPVTQQINPVSAIYKTMIKYTDKFNSYILCNNGQAVVSNVEYSCDFKDCFYKNNNYNRQAIGTNLVEDEEEWTVNINGNNYICTGHYNLYLSSYNTGNKEITLTPTNTMICKEAFDDGKYNYDSSSNDPYVTIVD